MIKSFKFKLSFWNPNREDFLFDRAVNKIRKKKPKSKVEMVEMVEMCLSVLGVNDFVIFYPNDQENRFVQVVREENGCVFDFVVVPRTWWRRYMYWRVLRILDEMGVKPKKIWFRLYDTDIVLGKYMKFESSCKREIVVPELNRKILANLIYRVMVAEMESENFEVSFQYGSWKKVWI